MNSNNKKLSNNNKIPVLGFGTYKSGSYSETKEIVKYALELGYRMIDTAYFYGNEDAIGDAIKESNVKREDIFLITKLWNDYHGYDNAIKAFNKSLNNLKTDYIDLYLIHWPNELNSETWKAFEYLYQIGKVKSIGVSNFKIGHLEELLKTAQIKPMVNQLEIHPFSQKSNMLSFCNNNDIKLLAWSPIMRGKVFSNELLLNLANKYNKTVAEIVLKWHIQRGVIPIPKSSNKLRIKENFDVFDFTISEEDMNKISLLDEGDEVSVTGVPDNTNYLKY